MVYDCDKVLDAKQLASLMYLCRSSPHGLRIERRLVPAFKCTQLLQGFANIAQNRSSSQFRTSQISSLGSWLVGLTRSQKNKHVVLEQLGWGRITSIVQEIEWVLRLLKPERLPKVQLTCHTGIGSSSNL